MMKRNNTSVSAAETLRILLYETLKDTDYERIYYDAPNSGNVRSDTDNEMMYSILKWIFTNRDKYNKELAQFSDEDIIAELNRRIESGTIDTTTRFHVTKKGSIN